MNSPKIGVFAPSNPLSRSPKPTDYGYLKSKGHEVFEVPQVREKTAYMAGSIDARVDAIHTLLEDDSVDILMAFWGGANSNQLLPHLDYDLFKKYPKPIVGFSDVTALLLAVHKMTGNKTYMGPGGITFDKPDPFDYSYEYFKRMIVDSESDIVIEDSPEYADDLYFLREDNDHRIIENNTGRKVYKEGTAKAPALAANLQTLLVLAGTDYVPELEGKVLFLEEAESEDPSMIHRFLTHLTQLVEINQLAGICVGRFPSQCGFDDDVTEEMIYEDVFAEAEIPIIYNLDFGHTDPLFTIPNGNIVEIDTEKGLIKFE